MRTYLAGVLGAAFVVLGVALVGLPLGFIGAGMLAIGLGLVGAPLACIATGVFLLVLDRRL